MPRSESEPSNSAGPPAAPPPALSPDEVERLGEGFRAALATALQRDPDQFGLRDAVEQAGNRLMDTLQNIDRELPAWLAVADDASVDERRDEFVARFSDEVAGSVGGMADAAVRHAATDAAVAVLDGSPRLRHAVDTGTPSRGGISSELFCTVYRIFFAQAVTNFLKSVITAKITLIAPILPVIDPAGHIATWIADMIMSIVPTPCDQSSAHDSGPPIAELGRSLVRETVERALGLPVDGAS
ncbi:hypothetical protein [Kutzneria sp. CA-103260]|uniref:hypothetical protein n=1 Tax=Kutzneria sp. CA-103260 TaxID=2802641 RepID=UPI001BA9F75A|nr:hypothetical protein [Kutzneria sp. CA-103260]